MKCLHSSHEGPFAGGNTLESCGRREKFYVLWQIAELSHYTRRKLHHLGHMKNSESENKKPKFRIINFLYQSFSIVKLYKQVVMFIKICAACLFHQVS